MKIIFRTESGFTLSSVDFLVFMFCFIAFIKCFIFAFTDGENLRAFSEKIIGFSEYSKNWDQMIVTHFLRLISGAAAILTFWLSIYRVLKGFYSYFKLVFLKTIFPLSRGIYHKINAEILAYPNTSEGSFSEQLISAQSNLESLELASGGYLKRSTINKPRIPTLEDLAPHIKDIIYPPSTHSEKVVSQSSEIKALTAKFQEISENELPVIEFIASPVQPSIFKLLKRLTSALPSEYVKFTKNISTGPEVVKYAAITKQSNEKMGKKTILIFVAPLSAFAMYDNPKEDHPMDESFKIERNFEPICSLFDERQDLLVAEGQISSFINTRTLFYYENSTAEELVANKFSELENVFKNRADIRNFSDYKSLLKGNAIFSKGEFLKLKAGDAIVTWPPLTEYYSEESIEKGERPLFLKKSNDIHALSKICMFADARIYNHDGNEDEAAWAFIRLILKTIDLFLEESRSPLPNAKTVSENISVIFERRAFFKELVD